MRGDGRVFLRGTTWWIAYYGPGKDGGARQYRESSGSSDEKRAQKLLRDRLREVGNHRVGKETFRGPAADRITVRVLLDAVFADYENRGIKSLRQTKGHAVPVHEFFDFRRAMTVTPDLIRKYIAERRAAHIGTATINRELAILKRAFSFAEKEGRLPMSPHIPSAGPEDNVRRGFFEASELDLMLEHLDPVMAEMTRFGFRTGWRASEIRLLTWSRVDRTAREVRLDTSKNGRPRLLPLDEDLAGLFDRLWTARQYTQRDGTTALSEFVFHNNGRPLARSVFVRRWARAREAAGLPDRLFHDLRRTAVRNLVRGGVRETVAMTISGHLTRSVFDRYNITSTEDTLAALQKQREYVEGQPKNVKNFRK